MICSHFLNYYFYYQNPYSQFCYNTTYATKNNHTMPKPCNENQGLMGKTGLAVTILKHFVSNNKRQEPNKIVAQFIHVKSLRNM